MSSSDNRQSAIGNQQSEVSRRGFLKAGLAAGAGALLPAAPGSAGVERARVAVASSRNVFADDRTLRADVVRQLVDSAVASALSEQNPAEAWRRLARPDDVVGVKVNCLAGDRLSTRIEVVRAIAQSLGQAGVPPNRVIVWDRRRDDLVRARYPVADRSAFRCLGNDEVGYNERMVQQGEIGSLFSTIVTDLCSVIINVPVLKDHDLAGISVALKSAFGAINNPNKYHLISLHPAIVDVNRVQVLRRKTVIHICDATFGCYHTGPTPAPRYIERLGAIYASRDPVALDATAWQKIEELRRANNQPSLVGSRREPRHIALGAQALLGLNDPARIDLVRLDL